MIADASEKKFQVLIVDDLSRLSRDAGESHRILKELKFHQIRVISVADGVDSQDESHKLIFGLKSLINEEYLDALSKKTRRGLEGRAINGKHCGGKVYGYDIIRDEVTQSADLKINAEQAEIVKEIFTLFASGHSPRAIAALLNERGIPSPRKSKKLDKNSWCSSAIYGDMKKDTGILNNETYIGTRIWNKRSWVKNPDTGKRKPINNPKELWKISERPDLRIIPQDLWDRVKHIQQKTREKSKNIQIALHNNARTGRGPKYVFSSLLKCGKCGANMIITDHKNYGCATHKNRGPAACDNNSRLNARLLKETYFMLSERFYSQMKISKSLKIKPVKS
jgi:DNA invertase Pin-like site-specific DNA recombinase